MDATPLRQEIWSGLRKSLGFACSCFAVFGVVYLIRGASAIQPFSLSSALAACLVSGVVGGLLFGILYRWRSSVAGRAGVGAIVTFGVVCAIGIVTEGIPDRDGWRVIAMFTAFGAVLGAATMIWRKPKR